MYNLETYRAFVLNCRSNHAAATASASFRTSIKRPLLKYISISTDRRKIYSEMASQKEIFYEPGKTDHGLPRDPYKVRHITHLEKSPLEGYKLTDQPSHVSYLDQ